MKIGLGGWVHVSTGRLGVSLWHVPFTNSQRQPYFYLVFPGSAELRMPPFSPFPSPLSIYRTGQIDAIHGHSAVERRKWDSNPGISGITHFQPKPGVHTLGHVPFEHLFCLFVFVS